MPVRNHSQLRAQPLPSTAIIIVGYNGHKWLNPCLESLAPTVGRRDILCLVDNGGNGDAIPREFPWCRYQAPSTPSRLGFAEANNFALTQLAEQTEYICFLNQDTRVAPGWLDKCLRAMRSDDTLAAISPLLTTWDGLAWDSGFAECARETAESVDWLKESPAAVRGKFCDNLVLRTPRVSAAAMVVRTDVLQQTGPFDPIFGSYYEDYDLCRRIREKGYRIGICTGAVVQHWGGSSVQNATAQRKRMRVIVRNRAILRFREAGPRRWPTVARHLLSTFPRNVGRGLLKTASSQPVAVTLGAHWDLLNVMWQVTSACRDNEQWQRYLRDLGWPPQSQGPASC